MTDDRHYPKPGDLIEIKRGHFEHWALYLGDGNVIHVTTADEGAPSLSASSETRLIRMAKVKKELLKDVAGNDDWDVNNKYDCLHTPLPVEKIIRRAEQWIGSIAPYNMLGSNSEDFVRKLRYGGQVSD
ncbi:HRSL1 enzyme, partial [Certhia brachydactyla]|nr:HRSL1 enzyme [Certhia brachydactyla]